MIDHVWTVVCSRSVVDERSKNISIQNVVEQVNIVGTPAPEQVIPMQLEVVSFWTRTEPETPAAGRLRVAFNAPSGKVLGQLELPINLAKHERFRSQMRFAGIPAEEVGRHYFYVDLQEEGRNGWQRVAAVPVTITFKPPEEEAQEGTEPEEED